MADSGKVIHNSIKAEQGQNGQPPAAGAARASGESMQIFVRHPEGQVRPRVSLPRMQLKHIRCSLTWEHVRELPRDDSFTPVERRPSPVWLQSGIHDTVPG